MRFGNNSSTHLELIKTTVLIVVVPQHVVLATRPFFVIITLALELLRQIVQSLQPAAQVHQYVLVAFLLLFSGELGTRNDPKYK